MTIIREKQVPVSNLGSLLPNQVVERVKDQAKIRFNMTDHTRCWQHFEVRPPANSPDPQNTKPQFCRWDHAFERWVYAEAWVDYLVRKLGDDDLNQEILGRDPRPLNP